MKEMFFFQQDSFIYFQVDKEIKTYREYQKGVQSKADLAGHRKTHHLDVQGKNLTHLSLEQTKIEQTNKKAATKVVNKKLH